VGVEGEQGADGVMMSVIYIAARPALLEFSAHGHGDEGMEAFAQSRRGLRAKSGAFVETGESAESSGLGREHWGGGAEAEFALKHEARAGFGGGEG
jgi:hypothetical protein